MDVQFNTMVISALSSALTTICPSDKSPVTVYSPACVMVYTESFCVIVEPSVDVMLNSPVISVL